MGVSIGWQRVGPKTVWITPGARSQMHKMLCDLNLYGTLDKSRIEILCECAESSEGELRGAFEKLIAAIENNGEILVIYEF